MDLLEVCVVFLQYHYSKRYGFSMRSGEQTPSIKEVYLLSVSLDVLPIGSTEDSV